jgi:hypothetical protein
VDEVEANAPRASDGRFLDPNTLLPTNEPVIGHRAGYEFWRLRDAAQAEGVSRIYLGRSKRGHRLPFTLLSELNGFKRGRGKEMAD